MKSHFTKFEILDNGNLRISLNYGKKGYISEQRKAGHSDDDIFLELIEYHVCNGYSLVSPEAVAALTESIILSDTIIDEETELEAFKEAKVWYNPRYMLKSEVQELLDYGYIDLQLTETVVDEVTTTTIEEPEPTRETLMEVLGGLPLLKIVEPVNKLDEPIKGLSPRTAREWFELIPYQNVRKEALETFDSLNYLPLFDFNSLSDAIEYLVRNTLWRNMFWIKVYNSIIHMENSVKLKKNNRTLWTKYKN